MLLPGSILRSEMRQVDRSGCFCFVVASPLIPVVRCVCSLTTARPVRMGRPPQRCYGSSNPKSCGARSKASSGPNGTPPSPLRRRPRRRSAPTPLSTPPRAPHRLSRETGSSPTRGPAEPPPPPPRHAPPPRRPRTLAASRPTWWRLSPPTSFRRGETWPIPTPQHNAPCRRPPPPPPPPPPPARRPTAREASRSSSTTTAWRRHPPAANARCSCPLQPAAAVRRFSQRSGAFPQR